MKVLLVGGPANGAVLRIVGIDNIRVEFRGMQYIYHEKRFASLNSEMDAVYPIWVNGDMPPDVDILSMICKEKIASIGKASELPPEFFPMNNCASV